MKNVIYYLPGWSGRLHTGLGQGLLSRGFDVTGRETRDAFKDMTFTDQVATVGNDLREHFWTEDAHVVANSFGGYLFLHAQAGLRELVHVTVAQQAQVIERLRMISRLMLAETVLVALVGLTSILE